jgi:predicted phosphodiesterase
VPTYALLSDIHGNLSALEAVREALPDCDKVVVAGDHCLEGPKPAEVLDLLVESGWTLILGNTDQDIVDGPEGMKKLKAARVAWTRERLGPERIERLTSLPREHRLPLNDGGTLLAVHANPRTLDEHLYPTMSEDELHPYLDGVTASILAFGHLHIPYIRRVNGLSLVDVASVGHPKDRDRRAAFTLVRSEGPRLAIEQVRVPYDVERTLHDLRRSGMPGAEEQAEDLLRASYDKGH